jgi:acetate---CoA ligase (ADP-forming)
VTASAAPRSSTTLNALFEPRSIAVVGASDDPRTINGRTLAHLRAAFPGEIIPVHPQRATVQGLPAAASLADLAHPPDLVIVAIRAEAVIEVAEQAGSLGVPALLVFSSGFAETGPAGLALQRRLLDVAQRHRTLLFGPNCLGVINVSTGVLATFADLPEPGSFRPGGVALVSQSGAFGSMLFKAAQRTGIAMSYFAATGNEADVTQVDVLADYVERPDVHTILGFGEQIGDPQGFRAVAERARALEKPIVFLKVGRSGAGARAAISHTGSLTGAERVIDAAFQQYGVVRADTMADLLGYARIFEQRRRPAGRRLGIVTVSGGVGVLLADAAVASGLEVPELAGESRARVAATIPAFGSPGNPVDCTAQIGVNDRAALATVLRTVAALPEVDMVCYAGLSEDPGPDWLDALQVLASDVDKPAVVWGPSPVAVARLSDRGVTSYLEPEGAIRALAALANFHLVPPLRPPASARDPRRSRDAEALLASAGPGVMAEPDARRLLSLYGIAGPAQEVVHDGAGALDAAARIGYPIALKVLSRDLPHKSDAGGVSLGLRTAPEVENGYRQLLAAVAASAPAAAIDGVLVQAMIPAGLELLVGLHRDRDFGPVLTVGLGGTHTEIIDRTASRLAPVGGAEAGRALAEVAGGRLLRRDRGLTPAALEAVCAIVVAVGDLAAELDLVTEVDLNPVIAHRDGAAVADALVVVTRGERP